MVMLSHFSSATKKLFKIKLIAASFVLGFGMISLAEKPVEQEELKERIRAVGAELQELREGKGAPKDYKEYYELQKEIQELHRASQEELREPQQRISKLWQDKNVKKWHQKISEKQNELRQLRNKLQSEIHKRAAELQKRRQKELAAVATAETLEVCDLELTVLNYPRVDGSTSTQPLGLIIACKILGSEHRWAPTARYSGRWHTDEPGVSIKEYSPFPRAAGSSQPLPSHSQFSLIGYRPIAEMPEGASRRETRRIILINRLLTVHSGTHGAYVNVINGDADIGLVARQPSPDEFKLAEEKGVEIDVQPIALDAFVFIKNFKNQVASLSIKQIRDIYNGKISNWKEVGGPDSKINAYRRNRNSGSQELMESLVMKEVEFEELEHPGARRLIHQGMGGPYIALTHDEHGLAYSVYYYEHFMSGSPQTVPIDVDDVTPTFETIQSREYPFVTEVYISTLKNLTKDSPGFRFREWLLSPAGQAVVRESGYVPLRK